MNFWSYYWYRRWLGLDLPAQLRCSSGWQIGKLEEERSELNYAFTTDDKRIAMEVERLREKSQNAKMVEVERK